MSTLSRRFLDHAQATPDKMAVSCEGISLTYAELARLSRRWAAALVAHGVRHGHHIGVALENGCAFVALLLAAADLGAVLVPVSPSLGPAARARAFAAAAVRFVAGASGDGVWLAAGAAADGAAGHDIAALLAATDPDPPPFGWGQDADPFILTMTSGSTGDPKPIVLSQATKLARAAAACDLYGATAGDVTLVATPLYHSLAERLVLIALLTGGTAVVMARFSVREWIETVRRHQASFTIAVSSQLAQIADAMRGQAGLNSLRCVVSSSALLAPSVRSALLASLPCALHECYGASEIAIATSLDLRAEDAPGSVGRAAPGVEIRILDEGGNPLPAGMVGEIACRTPMLFDGYFGRPALTAGAMQDGYFRTGDLGQLDADGFLFFAGRRRDIIISGGINVFPSDIETALAGFPGITEAAAFAVPDARLGEVIGLAYVPDPPDRFDLRRLRHHCGLHLADFQQPRSFLALPALPRNAMGKLLRHALPELYRAANTGGPHG